MVNAILSVFSYSFMARAFLVGLLVSLCAALLGVCLVLKRFSMIGDGLSHVAFGAAAVAATFGVLDTGLTLPATVLAKRPENEGKTIVVLLPDTGDRYLSTPLFQE